MIQDSQGNKVTAKNKAKLVLLKYLEDFKLDEDCEDFDNFKRTEPAKVQDQIDKIMERMKKALVIK